MKKEIEILSFDEWLAENKDQDPRLNKFAAIDYFADQKIMNTGAGICQLRDGCGRLENLKPTEVLEFIEKLKAYILENKPESITFRDYDHSFEAFGFFQNDFSGVDNYLKRTYKKHVKRYLLDFMDDIIGDKL